MTTRSSEPSARRSIRADLQNTSTVASPSRHPGWGVGSLSLLAISELLGMPFQVAERLASEGLLPGLRLGGQWFFSPEAIERWLATDASPAEKEQIQLALQEASL